MSISLKSQINNGDVFLRVGLQGKGGYGGRGTY